MAAHGISNITKLDHHTKAKRMVMVHANQTKNSQQEIWKWLRFMCLAVAAAWFN
jgi:hypothetical protein